MGFRNSLDQYNKLKKKEDEDEKAAGGEKRDQSLPAGKFSKSLDQYNKLLYGNVTTDQASAADSWFKSGNDLMKEYNSFITSWKSREDSEKFQSSFNKRADDLIKQAEQHRGVDAGSVNSMVSQLYEMKTGARKAGEYYGKFGSEKDFSRMEDIGDYYAKFKELGDNGDISGYNQLIDKLEKEMSDRNDAFFDDPINRMGNTTFGSGWGVDKRTGDEDYRWLHNYAVNQYADLQAGQYVRKVNSDRELADKYYAADKAVRDRDDLMQVLAAQQTNSWSAADQRKWERMKAEYGWSDSDLGIGEQLVTQLNSKVSEAEKAKKELDKAGSNFYDKIQGYMQRVADRQEYERRQKDLEAYAREHTVLALLSSVGASATQGIDYINSALGNLGHNNAYDRDNYIPMSVYNMDATNYVQTIRGTVSQQIQERTDWNQFTKNVANFLYQTGMSIADSATQIAMFGPACIYFMGMSAASATTRESLMKGANNRQALVNGLAAGVAEAAFERFSVENFLNDIKSGSNRMLRNIVQQAGIEASEEFFTEISNVLTDAAIMTSSSTWSELVRSHREEEPSITESEAKWKAFFDVLGQAGMAALGGAVSGGVMGGFATAFNTMKADAYYGEKYGENVGDLVTEALEINPDNEYAKYIRQILDEGGNVNSDQIRRLAEGNENALREIDRAKMEEAVQKRLEELGEKGDIPKIAKALVNQQMGDTNSPWGYSRTIDSSAARQVAQELNPDSIYDSSVDNEWVKRLGTERVNEWEYNLKAGEPMPESKSAETAEGENTSHTEKAAEKPAEPSMDEYGLTEEDDAPTIDEVAAKYGKQADAVKAIYNLGVPNVLSSSQRQQSVEAFAKEFDIARSLGQQNAAYAEVQGSPALSYLTEQQRQMAYDMGRSARIGSDARRMEKIRAGFKNGTWKKGSLRAEGSVTMTQLNKRFKANGNQRTAVHVLRTIAEGTGINIVLFDSSSSNYTSEQGSFDWNTDEIRIDIASGINSIEDVDQLEKYVMLRTFSHEMTHFGEKWAPHEYTALQTAVFDTLATTKGADFVQNRVNEIRANDYAAKKAQNIKSGMSDEDSSSKALHDTMSEDLARREVVAEGMTDMLPQSKFMQKLAEDNPSVFGKLVKAFKSFVAKIKAYFSMIVDNPSREAQGLKQEIGGVLQYAQDLVDKYDAMLVSAIKNYQMSTAGPVQEIDLRSGTKSIPDEAILTDETLVETADGRQFSIRSLTHDIADGQMFKDLQDVLGWTEEQTNELKQNLEKLVKFMTPNRDILDLNESYGREGRRFSPYKPNSDPLYGISLDFSTLCSKRLLTQFVIENLQLRENRPMSATEQMAIRSMLIKYRQQDKALQVACAMCYVEAARLKAPKQMERWLADPTEALTKYFAKKNKTFNDSVKKAQADFKEAHGFARDATKAQMIASKAGIKAFKEMAEMSSKMRASYEPSAEEMAIINKAKGLPNSTYLTAANLANLAESDPVIYDAYSSFIRSATRSKPLESAEPYYYGDSTRDNGNGIVVTDTFIANVNRENGMRFSSWSDWRIQHMLDMMTAVIDMSVRGAAMHGYTKFPEEVRVFGKTGMMFNLSGVLQGKTGLNADGELDFSPTESVDFSEAQKVRDEFPEIAGMQCIGVSHESIRALLRSEFIDYVIPYHTSGLNAALRRMADIYAWKDYTQVQNAKKKTGAKMPEGFDKALWQNEPVFSEFFAAAMDPANGYVKGEPGIDTMRRMGNMYRQMCEERGLIPKFNDFADEENYWKLLIDRKMINQKTGKLIQQKAVKPIFDFSENGPIYSAVNNAVANYDRTREQRALDYVQEHWDELPGLAKELQKTEAQKKKDAAKAKKAAKNAAALGNEMLAAQPLDAFAAASTDEANPGRQFRRRASAINAEYMKAVDNGDWAAEARLVEEAARAAGYDSPLLYHGTDAFGFTEFRQGAGDYVFATTSDMVAKSYSGGKGKKMIASGARGDGIYALYGKMGKSLTVDAKGGKWHELPVPTELASLLTMPKTDTDNIAWAAKKLGYDSVVIKNVRDPGGRTDFTGAGDVYVFMDKTQVKSADMETRDNNGNLIPLTERFDSGKGDIRYQQRTAALTDEDALAAIDRSKLTEGEQKALAEYEREVKRLRRDYDGLQQKLEDAKRQVKVTKLPTARRGDVRKAANALVRSYSSKASTDTVSDQLMGLTNYIMQSGSDTDSREVWSRAELIARDIVSQAEVFANAEHMEVIKAIRKHFRSTHYQYEGGDTERSGYKGIMVFDDNGPTIDQDWDSLGKKFGYDYFPGSIINPTDMIEHIAELLQTGEERVNPYSSNMEATIDYAANEIIDAVLGDDIRQAPKTYADRMEAKLEKVKGDAAARLKEKVDEVRAHEREVAKKARADMREEFAEVLRKGKKAARDKQKAHDDQVMRDFRERTKENAEVKKYREKVLKKAKALSDMLASNSDKAHVPEALKSVIGDFLMSIDFSSKRSLSGGEQTQKDISYAEMLDRVRQVLAKQQAYMNNPEGGDGIDAYIDLPTGFVEQIQEHINNIKGATANLDVNTNRVAQMSSGELKDLNFILTVLKSSIGKINQLHVNGHFASVVEASRSTILAMNGKAADNGKAEGLKDFAMWENTLPYYAFQRFGEAGSSIFEGLQDGWDKLAFNTKRVIDFTKKTYSAKEAREWERKVHTIKLSSGREVQMTTTQIMALYCLAQREQAQGHLYGGGMRIGNVDIKNGRKSVKLRQTEPVLLTEEDVGNINALLTDRQREVADKLQRFMQDVGGNWGNEVSMARFGYRAFGEEHYFPIQSDDTNLPAVDPDARANDMFRLLNLSATKGLVKKANNALVVNSIIDVFDAHMSDMAKYNALALPILDAMKWYNFKDQTKADNGQVTTHTVQRSIERVYGKAGKGYYMSFIKDLNGAQSGGRGIGFYDRMISNYKVAAVAANMRVAFLQITSFVRAAAVIDPGYLIRGMKFANAKNEMEKYSGIATWKSLGFYDTNIGRGVAEQIKNEATWKDKLVEKSMIGAELGDKVAWRAMWNACKIEVSETQRGADGKPLKGDALMEATGKRFRDVIYATQVVDSTMTRSQLMRSKNAIAKASTAFMSETTVSYNLLMSAGQKYADDAKTMGKGKALTKNKGLLIRAFAAYVGSQLAAALVESLMDALRDDDEYETAKDKIWEAFFGDDGKWWEGNFVSDINPLNKIPVLKDAFNAITGYGNDRMETQFFTAITDAWKATFSGSGSYTTYGKLYKWLQAISRVGGAPISNAAREVQTLWNNTIGAITGMKLKTYDKGDRANIRDALVGGHITEQEAIRELVRTGEADDENDAYFTVQKWLSGDEEYSRYKKVLDAVKNGEDITDAMQELLDHGYSEKQVLSHVKSKVGDWYKGTEEDDPSIDFNEAVTMLERYLDMDIEDAEATVTNWSAKLETGTGMNEVRQAILAGTLDEDDAVDMYVEYGGKEREAAEKAVAEHLVERDTGYAPGDMGKPLASGKLLMADAADALVKHMDYSYDEATDLLEARKFKAEHGVDWDVDAVKKYIAKIQPSGISVDAYSQYMEGYKNCKGTDKNGDGKTDSGSKKAEVMALIHSLPLTKEQKDELYYLNGWSARTINEAPWH